MKSKELASAVKGAFRGCAKRAAVLALLCAWTASAGAVDWSAYRYSFNITFPGYTGSETLSNFPALVRLSAELNDFDYAKCAENGGDLRFSDSDGNLLPSEVDTWNPDGESLVWVRVPSLNFDTVIKAYYGCPSPAAVDPKEVWSNGYLGVWHLNEDSSPLADSASSGLPFKRSSSHESLVDLGKSGIVGNAAEFDVVTDGTDAHMGYLSCADKQKVLTGMKQMTIEMWIHQRAWIGSRRLLYRKSGNDRAFDFLLNSPKSDGTQSIAFYFGTTNTEEEVAQADVGPAYSFTQAAAVGTWRHVAATFDSVNVMRARSYANGVLKGSYAVTNDYVILPKGDDIKLGNLSSGQAFPGSVDEMRISSVARSADWLKATYDTVNDADFAVYEQDNDWTKYARRLEISFPGAPETAIEDFPVLVKLSEAGIEDFDYGDFVKPNGGDLRFADERGRMLSHEVDTWNTNGVSYVWVKIPLLSSATKITAYYGWLFAPAVDPRDVWSNGYLGVWHLGESGFTMADSSQDGIDFTCESGYADYVGRGVEGLAGNAVEFDLITEGSNAHKGHLYLKDTNHRYCGRSAMTIEYWVNQRQAAHNRRLMYCKTGNDRAYDIFSQTSQGGYDKFNFVFGTTNTMTSVTNNPQLTVNGKNSDFGTWKYHSVVFDSEVAGNCSAYIDGSFKSAKSLEEGDIMLPVVKDLRLGNLSGGQAFPGKFDELRISSVARSAEWMKATYDTMTSDSFAAFGRARDNRFHPFRIYFR